MDGLNFIRFRNCLAAAVKSPDSQNAVAACETKFGWTLSETQKAKLMREHEDYFENGGIDGAFPICHKSFATTLLKRPEQT